MEEIIIGLLFGFSLGSCLIIAKLLDDIEKLKDIIKHIKRKY